MGIPFHETVMGNRFFTSQLPQLIRALNRLSEAVEESNRLKAAESTDGKEQ